MYNKTLKNPGHGAHIGNDCGGFFITAIKPPSSRCFIMKTVKCSICGELYPHTKEFFHSAGGDNLRHQCKDCVRERLRVKQKSKICDQCGNEFMPQKSTQRFCTKECANTYKYPKYYTDRYCVYCGSKLGKGRKKYCSRECQWRAANLKRSKKPITKKCQVCGKEFSPYTSLDKFCSANCRIESMKKKRDQRRRWGKESLKRRTGKNNPGYRNGNYMRTSKRTAVGNRKFQKTIKAIKERMIDERGYIYCQNCGTNQSLRFEGHHIIYRSEKPNHPNLHDKENAILLCIECHNDFHKHKSKRDLLVRVRKLNKLFGEDVFGI